MPPAPPRGGAARASAHRLAPPRRGPGRLRPSPEGPPRPASAPATSLRHPCLFGRHLARGHRPHGDGATHTPVGRVHDHQGRGHGLGEIQSRFDGPPAAPGVEATSSRPSSCTIQRRCSFSTRITATSAMGLLTCASSIWAPAARRTPASKRGSSKIDTVVGRSGRQARGRSGDEVAGSGLFHGVEIARQRPAVLEPQTDRLLENGGDGHRDDHAKDAQGLAAGDHRGDQQDRMRARCGRW